MTSSRSLTGCKTFFKSVIWQVLKSFRVQSMCARACVSPRLQRGNQAEGCINTAFEFSQRANISSPSLSLPSITSSRLCHPPDCRRDSPRSKEGRQNEGKMTHVTCRIITTGGRVHICLSHARHCGAVQMYLDYMNKMHMLWLTRYNLFL